MGICYLVFKGEIQGVPVRLASPAILEGPQVVRELLDKGEGIKVYLDPINFLNYRFDIPQFRILTL